MSKHFEIEGYWKDTKELFSGYIVREFDDAVEDESLDDQIFFYGLSEEDIQQAIQDKDNTVLDFVITNYEKVEI